MSMQEQLRERTKQFAFRIIRLFKSLPRSTEALILGKQLLRSGTAVAANYRAVNRARSRAEFIAKIGVVLEEADETVFWLEALTEAGVVKPALLAPLLREANELAAIFAASQRTARSNPPSPPKSPDDPMTRSPDSRILPPPASPA
ncbi:MAG: four helix bundle protein [Terriglobales bacterium]